MLVPRPRLLWCVGLFACPALALAPSHDAAGVAALAVVGGLFLLAAFDALTGWDALDGLTVSLPPVLRLAKGRPGVLPMRLAPGDAGLSGLRLAPGLGRHLSTPQPELLLDLPGPAASLLDWPVCGPERGSFPITACHAEAVSRLGFWARRRVVPVACEVRVQPDLVGPMRRNAAFLVRGAAGARSQRQVGRGREFEKLRDYIPGDGLDEIHWRATAKRGHPVTKVFQVERTQEVYVVVDASRLSGRILAAPGTGPEDAGPPEPLLEQFIQSALILGAVAERQGDHFGLVTFADQPDAFLRASSGRAHFSACREQLVGLRCRPVSPDFEELAAFLRVRLRRRALLLFLTGLDDPVAAEGFVRGVDLLRRQHLCAVVQPQPRDAVQLFSRDHVATTEDVYGALAGHLQWQGMRELQAVLHRRGVTLVPAPAEGLAAALITRYLDVKRRQAL